MAIKRIKVTNFKSFRDLDLELHDFNLLVGGNASGKSNFIQVFRFLRDIVNHGLNNAISMQGGIEYLWNVGIGSKQPLSMEITSVKEFKFAVAERRRGLIAARIYETNYRFSLKFDRRGLGFKIIEDTLVHKCRFVRLDKRGVVEKEELGKGEISLCNVNGNIEAELTVSESVPLKEADVVLPFLRLQQLESSTILLESAFFYISPLQDILKSTSVYSFDPTHSKRAISIAGKADLEEDASNLAIVLKQIGEDEAKKRKFSNLIKDLLPFVADLGVVKLGDRSLLFRLQEVYTREKYLPAPLVSDGTISLTALIIALYFQKNSLMIIDEPERYVHPYLISRIADMMKEASAKRQIIATTHNPEMVKQAGMGNLLMVVRNSDGFSVVSRLSEKEDLKTFLENEIGIDELYVQNLLGI